LLPRDRSGVRARAGTAAEDRGRAGAAVKKSARIGTAILAALALVEPAKLSQAIAQVSLLQDDRFAGLQWRFVRIRYHAWTTEGNSQYKVDYWGEPLAIDAPAAEQNPARHERTVTSI